MAINKNKVMEAAQKFVEKGQVDKAIKEYLKVVQEDPKDVRCWLKIGDLYAKKGAKQEATETYLKVAQFYGEQGFYLKAVAVYKQILKIDARLVDVNLKLAEVYKQLGLLSDAMQQYELVAAHYHREGKTREALATIKDLVELDPENVATRIKLAELYSKEGMATEAIAEFGRAADFLRAHNRMDDFIKVAERLVWHQPENHAVNRELAQLYLKRNDPRRALQKLQACFKADPRDVDTLSLLASAFQALDQKPKTISVWKELARIHQENGQQGQAQDVYRRILQLTPDDADALAALGRAPRAAGTGGVPAIPGPPAGSPPPRDRDTGGTGGFPRVATPIAGNRPPPAADPMRQSGSAARLIDSAPPRERDTGGAVRRPTGSIPIVDPSFMEEPPPPTPLRGAAAVRGRFDLDEEEQPSQPTSRRDARQVEVELEVDDFGGQDEMLLDPGADPAEAQADEIAKILTETDVYTKYGLHQKAIDHLKKVFEIDAKNVEAREKLKDVYVALGRSQEAADELALLVEHTGSSQPDRAGGWLRELMAIAPSDPRAAALGRRFRLEAAMPMGSPVPAEIEAELDAEPELGFAPEVEVEAEAELELAVGAGDLESGLAVEAEGEVGVDFDELGLDAAPEMEPELGEEAGVMTSARGASSSPMEFELDDLNPPSIGSTTQVVSDDQVELALEEEEPAELAFDSGPAQAPMSLPPDAHTFDEPLDYSQGQGHGQAQLDHDDLGGDLGELSLDGAMDAELEASPELPPMEAPPELPPEAPIGYDEPIEEMDPGLITQDGLDAAPAAGGTGTGVGGSASLEDELDEADFFVGQNLFDEAREILQNLLGRYPQNRLVLAKLQDVEAMQQAAEGAGDQEIAEPPPEAEPEPLPEPPAEAPAEAAPKRPTVIAKPLGEADADTHYDLGLAYKEMGLYDEAIKEFLLVRDTPGRAVQCHLMIGLCHMERAKYSEAVTEFKNGLYVENISDRESLSLYFELGMAYEALGDSREALYYYEKVAKRDPRFRDVAVRAERVRKAAAAKGGSGRTPAPGDSTLDGTDDFSR